MRPNTEAGAATTPCFGPPPIGGGFLFARAERRDGAVLDRSHRDGTKHELKVLIAFDGEGNFDATLWLDGVIEVQGRYQGQDGPYRSRHFYFKHGVYSSRMFDYQLVSENVSVKKVTVGN